MYRKLLSVKNCAVAGKGNSAGMEDKVGGRIVRDEGEHLPVGITYLCLSFHFG